MTRYGVDAVGCAPAGGPTFGDRVREERTRKKLSQRKLGRLSGVTDVAISSIENAAVTPRLSTVVALCRALDVSADWLIFGHRHQDEWSER